ncbi:MAG: hypothetical protein DMG65_21820 [Candidatus Angelobacter sp. Gp1-AA117]|nr:MAG: hypothetical protein DMG65_21820 [Candidatus Angelobacter sp. Gp1-AA117]
MKRSIKFYAAAAVLLGLAAWPNHAWSQQDCLKLKKVWTSYDAVQQGKSLEVNVKFDTQNCTVSVEYGHNKAFLSSASDGGLNLRETRVDYEKVNRGSPVLQSRELQAVFYVDAPADVDPGQHQVSAVVEYVAIDSHGTITRQQHPFQVPVNVVAQNAHVKKHYRGVWDNPWNLFWEIPMFIAISPVLLVRYMTWDGC